LSIVRGDKIYEVYEFGRGMELSVSENFIGIKGVAWDRCAAIGGANVLIDLAEQEIWRVEVRSYGQSVVGVTGQAVVSRHIRNNKDQEFVTVDILLDAVEPPLQFWKWMPDPTQTN
jgi:hypothetical protein